MLDDLLASTFVPHLGIGIGLFTVIAVFFERVEKGLSEDTKLRISLWLLEVNPAEYFKSWPETFPAVFDTVFGDKHLSWRCFLRSSVASFAGLGVVVLVTLVWAEEDMGFAILFSDFYGTPLFLLLGMLGAALNLFPDYLSLLETRFVLRRMRRAGGVGLVGWLALDWLLTTAIFGFGVLFLVVFLVASSGEGLGRDLLAEWVQLFWLELPELLTGGNEFLSFYLWTTYLISIWLWLYALSGLIVRSARAVPSVRDTLNIEDRPLYSMGLVAGGLAALAWWGTALVIVVID